MEREPEVPFEDEAITDDGDGVFLDDGPQDAEEAK